MARTLALQLRPKTFGELVGQAGAVKEITGQYGQGREPGAWLLTGQTGTGKTTVARILALSLNCRHGKLGYPCVECRRNKKSFQITEVNASEVSGVEAIGQLVQGAGFAPIPPTRRKVYILDEAQRLSSAAQNLLLKYFEDTAKTTVWIVCTTEPNKILEAMKGRCRSARLRLLQAEDIRVLVRRVLDFAGKKSDPVAVAGLTRELWEAKVQQPRVIVNVVERYLAGATPREAVRGIDQKVNALAICRALEKGDWTVIKKELKGLESDELRGIRAQVAGYLQGMLMEAILGPRATEVARAIEKIARVDSMTDVTQGPATVGALYELCNLFGGERTGEGEGPDS